MGSKGMVASIKQTLQGQENLMYLYLKDFPYSKTIIGKTLNRLSDDKSMSFKRLQVVARCLQMSTDPGDLVLDPTCGSGPPPMWPNNGGGVGSPLIPLALRWRLPRADHGGEISLVFLADSEGRKRPRSPARPPRQAQPTTTSAGLFTPCPHITLKVLPTTPKSTPSGTPTPPSKRLVPP